MEQPKIPKSSWFTEEALPHEADLRTWLSSRFPSIQDVDDLVQEAFARLLRAYDSGPIVNPRASLIVTARNLALNQIRHRRYERPEGAQQLDPLSIADEVNSPPESLAVEEELQLLVKAIQSLPARCRQVMTLRKSEANIEVAKIPDRPVAVNVAGVDVQAVGMVFYVRLTDDLIDVMLITE